MSWVRLVVWRYSFELPRAITDNSGNCASLARTSSVSPPAK